jgi:hypothetical protein
MKRYGYFERFKIGFSIGPLLFYKTKHVVYVKKYIDRAAMNASYVNMVKLAYDEAKEELFRLIPYDFGFLFVGTYSDYDIDFNRYGILVEGIPRPQKTL